MDLDLSFSISLIVTFQLFFVAMFLIFHQKGSKRNNRILGLVFLLLAISIFDFTIRMSGVEIPIKGLHLIDDGFFVLYGPLIYLYTNGVVYKNFKLEAKHLLHMVPFGLFLIFLIINVLSLKSADQAEITEQIFTTELPPWVFIATIPVYLHIFIYLWLSNKTIATYRVIIRDKFSSIDSINLNWLSFIIRFFIIITLIAMIHNMLPAVGSVTFHRISLLALLVFTFYFANRVLLKALNQSQLFAGIYLDEREKYTGSNLDLEELEDYKSKLTSLMENEKLFLNPELSIQELADVLDTSPKVLSQVINQGFNQKFYDYINSHRCEKVKKILMGPDHKVTINEAMYQSGFNSKSSFNKEFKKLTGQTPSEYRKRQRSLKN